MPPAMLIMASASGATGFRRDAAGLGQQPGHQNSPEAP